MHLIRVHGASDTMMTIGDVADLHFERTSAVELSDHTWQVSGVATDAAIEELHRRGLQTETISTSEQLRAGQTTLLDQLVRSDVEGTDPRAYPMTVAAIHDRIVNLSRAYPKVCGMTTLWPSTHEGRPLEYLAIHPPNGRAKTSVVLVGGAHAREWVPPDALISLVRRLLSAYHTRSELVIPEFRDPNDSTIVYREKRYTIEQVRSIINDVAIFVMPCINPDGRSYSQSSLDNVLWRKNRRPASNTGDIGVDCNRNHDIAWDFERYYSGAAVKRLTEGGRVSKIPESYQYIGPSAASEPETRAVAHLINLTSYGNPIRYFVDVHSYSRLILYPWAIDGNQAAHEDENFDNARYDRTRDGRFGNDGYNEYAQGTRWQANLKVAAAMSTAISEAAGDGSEARERSIYTVMQGLGLYAATGTAADYAFSRTTGPYVALTIECGADRDGEGGFWPKLAIYPKIEREVQIALLRLLEYAQEHP